MDNDNVAAITLLNFSKIEKACVYLAEKLSESVLKDDETVSIWLRPGVSNSE
jgi:hypothetical protein